MGDSASREWVEYIVTQSDKTRNELLDRLSREFGRMLSALDPVMTVCAGRDVPVMVHTNEPVGHAYPGKTPNTLAQIDTLLKRFAANRIGNRYGYCLFMCIQSDVLAKLSHDLSSSIVALSHGVSRSNLSLTHVT